LFVLIMPLAAQGGNTRLHEFTHAPYIPPNLHQALRGFLLFDLFRLFWTRQIFAALRAS